MGGSVCIKGFASALQMPEMFSPTCLIQVRVLPSSVNLEWRIKAVAKQSTKSGTGRKKVALKDLPKSERELSSKEIKEVRGGTGDISIGGIKGESKEKDHQGEIVLSS